VVKNKTTLEENQTLRQEIKGREEAIADIKAESNKTLKVCVAHFDFLFFC
jgi:hypothetical protein